MPREEDHVASVVRDVVLSELSWVVEQPTEVIALDDHLVYTIHADADDLSFDFIPFVERALQVTIPAWSWCEACTVGQVCDLVVSHYRQRPAHERAAIEAGLAPPSATSRGAQDSQTARDWWLLNPATRQPGYRWSPFVRGRLGRLWRARQPGARSRRDALRAGPLFGKPSPALTAAAEGTDPVFDLVRDAVFWLLEAYLKRPRSTLSLDDDVMEPPYVMFFSFPGELLRRDPWHARHRSVPARVVEHPHRQGHLQDPGAPLQGEAVRRAREIEAQLRAWKVEECNAPPPRRWWEVCRWELPRWPV